MSNARDETVYKYNCKQRLPCFGEVANFVELHYNNELLCKVCMIKFYYLMVRLTRGRMLLTSENYERMLKTFQWYCIYFECFLTNVNDVNFGEYLFECDVNISMWYYSFFTKIRLPYSRKVSNKLDGVFIQMNKWLYKCIRDKECTSRFRRGINGCMLTRDPSEY